MEMQDAEEFVVEDNDNDDEDSPKHGKKERPVIRTAVDLQRLKLEKLMKNPDKPVIIPESHREKDFLQSVPSFVRNVMGSSAGAGSGEFHVYRHLRRKEYARQKYIQAKSVREQLDDDYRKRLDDNKSKSDEKTAKKRAKRLKKKQKSKQRGKKSKISSEMSQPNEESENDDDSSENDEDENTKDEDQSEKSLPTENVEDLRANVENKKIDAELTENNDVKKSEGEAELTEKDSVKDEETSKSESNVENKKIDAELTANNDVKKSEVEAERTENKDSIKTDEKTLESESGVTDAKSKNEEQEDCNETKSTKIVEVPSDVATVTDKNNEEVV